MMERAFLTLLRELTDGPAPESAWVLNAGDQGLLRSRDALSAAAASQVSGESSIAAHVDHLRYGIELMNRWSNGESPFAAADYGASWRRRAVSEDDWRALRKQLRLALERWSAAIQHPRDLTEADLTGVAASIVLLAYHLGAIRQMNRSIQGPKAQD